MKREAILKEEADHRRRCMVELNKKLVEDQLVAKEHILLHKMRSDETSVGQMFQEYFNFKYDIY